MTKEAKKQLFDAIKDGNVAGVIAYINQHDRPTDDDVISPPKDVRDIHPNTKYNPLMFSILCDRYDVANKLIDLGCNIDQRIDGTSALGIAIFKLDIKNDRNKKQIISLIQRIISLSTDISTPQVCNIIGNIFTPLQITRTPEIIKMLIDKNVLAHTDHEIKRLTLLSALEKRNEEIVELLVKNGININICDKTMGFGVLHSLVYVDSITKCEAIKLAINNGADPNLRDSKGFTPLMLATITGQSDADNVPQIIEVLVENKADIRLKSQNGYDVLELAVIVGKTAVVTYLLENYENITLAYKEYLYKLAMVNNHQKLLLVLDPENILKDKLTAVSAKTITVLTDAPMGTLGDVASAAKLIGTLTKVGYKINWIIRYDSDNVKTSGILNSIENVNIKLIEVWDEIKVNKDIETSLNTAAASLKDADSIIVYPTIQRLARHYDTLYKCNKPIIVATEYSTDTLANMPLFPPLSSQLRFLNINLFYLYTGPGNITVRNQNSGEDSNIEQLGMYLESPDKLQQYTLEAMLQEDSIKILGQLTPDEYRKHHDLFFAYVNKLENTYHERLANFYLGCIKLSMQDPSKTIDLIGPIQEDTFTWLSRLIKFDLELKTKTFELKFGEKTEIIGNTSPTITVRMLNPFPLKHESMLALMNESKKMQNPVLITGDQSLSEAISIGVPFLYQTMSWKVGLIPGLITLARKNNLTALADYLELYSTNHKDYNQTYIFYKANQALLQEQYAKLRDYISNLYDTFPNSILRIMDVCETHKRLAAENFVASTFHTASLSLGELATSALKPEVAPENPGEGHNHNDLNA